MTRKLTVAVAILPGSIVIAGCAPRAALNCTTQGMSGLFFATFDADAAGSPPASPGGPMHYGPPGATLAMAGPTGTALVVNSTALGSRALRIGRVGPGTGTVTATVGDIGEAPYNSGVYVLEYHAVGDTVPNPGIAGLATAVLDSDGDAGPHLKLFDGSYHGLESGSFVRYGTGYDPTVPHVLHVEIDMAERLYGVCLDGIRIAADRPIVGAFDNVDRLQFIAPSTLTEAFSAVVTVDSVRISKR
jgi:hypothetical protein